MSRTPPADEDDPGEPEAGRLVRVAGDRGLSLSERVGARVQRAVYATPLHRMRLRGRYPLKLLAVPADPVPGDPHIGERITAGRLVHAGHTAMTRGLDFAAATHPAAWREWADSWAWLRDLAAAVPDRASAARLAEPLTVRWLDRFGEFDAVAWRADITGARLLFACAYAPLILSSADHVYRSTMLNALARWARHLDRAAFKLPDGMAKAWALTGLYAAGLLIPGGEARAEAAAKGLGVLLDALVYPDGGIATRAAIDAADLAELLLFAGAGAIAAGHRPPLALTDALARLVPGLKGLVLGDGRIGAWQGGAVIDATRIDRIVRAAAPQSATARGGRWSGYHRLAAGKTVLVIDAGPPPVARIGGGGHASTLAFEMSDGPDRVIVNCGGERGLAAPLPAELANGLRTTAAHSTLIVADTNSTQIRPDGALARGVEEVLARRQESEEGQWLEASHDGYVRRFGMTAQRRLFISPSGTDVRGEDRLEPAGRALGRRGAQPFDIRFHLGPRVEATPTADGAGALLKLPSGKVWAFKAVGGSVSIEPSLWIDAGGTIERTQQLVVHGETAKGAAQVAWSFKRAGK